MGFMLRKIKLMVIFVFLVIGLAGISFGYNLMVMAAPISTVNCPAILVCFSPPADRVVSGQRFGLIQVTLNYTNYLPIIIQSLSTPSPTPSLTPSVTLSATPSLTPSATPSSTPVTPPAPVAVLESFENSPVSWQVFPDVSSGGNVQQSSQQVAEGNYSARLSTNSSAGKAQIRVNFSDPATGHTWEERPGTWRWQWGKVYLPSTTVANLGTGQYFTLAGFWPNTGGTYGWWLRVKQGGELYVYGYDSDGVAREFRIYGVFPQDRWVDLEMGFHSQSGPGVKRAFAFLIDGNFYGWYHQGHMTNETFDRVAMGILSTNSSAPLVVFIDQWRVPGIDSFPGGPDNRSTINLQEQDFRALSGKQWQIDWSTWGNDLRLNSQYGIYSNNSRLQSGRNLERMPDLTSGWAEIEIDWPQGTPGLTPTNWFGPMMAFRKEINREQNLEIQFEPKGGGAVDIIYDAWNGSPVVFGRWAMPVASVGGGSHIPEPGDILRVRWEQVTLTNLNVRVSFYDASANQWYADIINTTHNITNIPNSPTPINFTDGYHTGSAITIDSTQYSIRRYRVGSLAAIPVMKK